MKVIAGGGITIEVHPRQNRLRVRISIPNDLTEVEALRVGAAGISAMREDLAWVIRTRRESNATAPR